MSTLSGISSRPVARDSSTSLSAADDQDISGLLQGSAWNATSLTFSFPTSSDQYGTQATYGDNDPFNGFSAFNLAPVLSSQNCTSRSNWSCPAWPMARILPSELIAQQD